MKRELINTYDPITDEERETVMDYFWNHHDNRDSTIAKFFGMSVERVVRITLPGTVNHFINISRKNGHIL